MLETARKLVQDVHHGGKFGPRTTLALVELIETMASEIERLERRMDREFKS